MRRFVTEFIGTFFLVLTIVLVVTAGEPVAALAIGSALMVMVYMGGHVSGAHYNPAVTLAVYLARKLPAADVAPYMLSQVAGGLVAALIGFWLAGQTFAPAPGPSASLTHALVAEALFTFALALVVLNVAVSRAMCLACIVASPRLLESRARTIEQMRLINALCRFVEMAEGGSH